MNKSLEALENLVHCKSETKCKECKHKYRCTMERDYNTIKQDLERKKQLEKEIAELKDKIDYLQEEFEGWQSAYEWSQAKNAILKLENQELKKVIDIIKCFMNYVEVEFDTFVTSQCTDEGQKLLKEVLNNDQYQKR